MAKRQENERVRLQYFVNAEVAEKIDYLASRVRMTRGEFMERLTEAGLEDNEWIIKTVTHPIIQGITDALKEKGFLKKPT